MTAGELVPELVAELEPEQADAAAELARVLAAFGDVLERCHNAGLDPVRALECCGVDVPMMARPLVARFLTPQPA